MGDRSLSSGGPFVKQWGIVCSAAGGTPCHRSAVRPSQGRFAVCTDMCVDIRVDMCVGICAGHEDGDAHAQGCMHVLHVAGRVHLRRQRDVRTSLRTCLRIRLHTCLHTCLHTHLHISAHMSIHIPTHMRTHLCTLMSTYVTTQMTTCV